MFGGNTTVGHAQGRGGVSKDGTFPPSVHMLGWYKVGDVILELLRLFSNNKRGSAVYYHSPGRRLTCCFKVRQQRPSQHLLPLPEPQWKKTKLSLYLSIRSRYSKKTNSGRVRMQQRSTTTWTRLAVSVHRRTNRRNSSPSRSRGNTSAVRPGRHEAEQRAAADGRW